jgi:hypothetical protein
MRYLIAYIYILLSGVAMPFALQARDLIGREYFLRAGEITALSLLEDFFILSSLMCTLFFVLQALFLLLPFFRNHLRMRRILNAILLAFLGFSSASLALTDNTEIYGNTWAPGEGFMAFVVPVWPAILIIVAAGAYLGAQIDQGSTGSRRQAAA